MGNEQPPRYRDQAVSRTAEPTLAEFRELLVDAVQEYPAAGFWRSTLQEGMTRIVVDLIDTYTAARAEAGSAPDARAPLTRDYLVHIARAHHNATRTGGAALDGLLDQIAHDLDLNDVRIMRGASAAITEAMPRIALTARENGKSPDEIARATGYTTSRIAQYIRQDKERRGPLTTYTWRIDTLDADTGRYGWTEREHGEDEARSADLPRLAEQLLDETGAYDQRARIFVWEGDASDDTAAEHTAERPAR